MKIEWERNFRLQMRALREATGESQSGLAKRVTAAGLPFHQPTIQRIEDGERPIRLDEAYVIAHLLRTPLQVMVRDDFVAAIDAAKTRMTGAMLIMKALTDRVEAIERERPFGPEDAPLLTEWRASMKESDEALAEMQALIRAAESTSTGPAAD